MQARLYEGTISNLATISNSTKLTQKTRQNLFEIVSCLTKTPIYEYTVKMAGILRLLSQSNKNKKNYIVPCKYYCFSEVNFRFPAIIKKSTRKIEKIKYQTSTRQNCLPNTISEIDDREASLLIKNLFAEQKCTQNLYSKI